ncbi:MAG TPA: UPF0182 family protein [Bryobacteraceae bacterium]|jgi:hypothetical protein|nr:UPF0182 family protein [Bryobacteraceae bacterium]
MADLYLGERKKKRRIGVYLALVLIALLIFSRYIASTVIDYAWWSELGQIDAWYGLLLYGTVPVALATLLFWGTFQGVFLFGRRHDKDRRLFGMVKSSLVSRLTLLVFFFVALIAANAAVDNWTVVRFVGGLRLAPNASEYVDPIFGKPLHFYFFGLPFYHLVLRVVLVEAIAALIIYWLAANLDTLSRRLPTVGPGGLNFEFETHSLTRGFDSTFVRSAGAVLLLGLAVKIFLDRYDLLFEDHGAFLVGVDWVADHVVIPLQWLMIGGAAVAALLVIVRRARWALALLLLAVIRFVVPPIVSALYVRPTELALERPYIQHHIDATREAFALNKRVKETVLAAAPEIPIDYDKNKPLLSNVRLWDWQAFHDTISQIQPLRPYVYLGTDVDRYQIGGQLRQVLLVARELDIRQLGEAQNHWINPHLMYTHGYGLIMAEANRITPDGLPYLFVKNAPPEVTQPALKFNTPDIYYGEIAHEPVYVDTAQQEFDYPSGSQSVYTHYSGPGGISVSSPFIRLAAAVKYSDFNVLLTSYLTAQSRMMIRRPIIDRLSTLAGFLRWDSDPYIVLTNNGHLVWMVDGYMTSAAHPYSRPVGMETDINYIRNSVKATVDAYTGEVNMYVFDSADPLIAAYVQLFPKLFKPLSAMPPDIRAHARYPENLFSAQAEIYRTFHMRDPEAFYNRADLWDLAKSGGKQQDGESSAISPTYVVASLPNEGQAEFLLMTPFTPANKNNLIGYMAARCDGEHLGELVFVELSKQNIIFGPLQIDARVNQDQNISKDLSLWNQQGSQVLRGQTLVLPIDNSFLYVEPIYIQASQASMPQLKKVALAMGDQLAYADTYEESLSQLIGRLGGKNASLPAQEQQPKPGQPTSTAATPSQPSNDEGIRKLQEIRDHLARYRSLSAEGKWAEAGKELDAIQSLLQR